jgi:hypothetical protein
LLDEERDKLREENRELRELNDALAAAMKIDGNYARGLLEKQKEMEQQLFDEYEEKCKHQREFMVTKLDEFLKMEMEKLEEHLLHEKLKELMAKGGKALVEEVLGRDGVKCVEEMENEQAAQEKAADAGGPRHFMLVPRLTVRWQSRLPRASACSGGRPCAGLPGPG